MVDEYDSETENFNDNNGSGFSQGSFEERFPRPNAARVMQSPNRFIPPFLMRPSIRPPFNLRFDNKSSPVRHERFPTRMPNYGPDNIKMNNRVDHGYRFMAPKELPARQDVPNRFGVRNQNRDYQNRNMLDRFPFPTRFPPPMDCQPPPRINRPPLQRFPETFHPMPTSESCDEKNKFVSAEEEEEAIIETNTKCQPSINSDNCEKLETVDQSSIDSLPSLEINREEMVSISSTNFIKRNESSTFSRSDVSQKFEKSNSYSGNNQSNATFGNFERPNSSVFGRQNPSSSLNKSFDGFNQAKSFEKSIQSHPFDKSKQSFDKFNHAQSYDKFNQSNSFENSIQLQPFDKSNQSQSFDRFNQSQSFDNFNKSKPFEKSIQSHPFNKSNDSHSFDKLNQSKSFDKPNVPFVFNRSSAPPPFERPNSSPLFNRSNVQNVGQFASFERPNTSRIYRPPTKEVLNPIRFESPSTFERPKVPRMEPPIFERPHIPRMEAPIFERPNVPRIESPIFERSNIPRMEPSIFERPKVPRMEPPLFGRPTLPKRDPTSNFDRAVAPRLDHAPTFERPKALPIDYTMLRPQYYPLSTMPPPHFSVMPLMSSVPPPLPPVSTAINHPVMTTVQTQPPGPFPIMPTMPPPNNRPNMPTFFDPRLRFMSRPPDRPMMPPFPMPPTFRPPFAHIPPPNMMQAPPQPIQADPSLIQSRVDNSISMATLNDEDVWVQNPTADGRFYYYHWKTRQTNWEKPEGVRVINQTELNNILANKTQPTISSGPMQITTTSIGAPTEKSAEVADWNDYKSPEGRHYYHNRRTGVTTWDKPQVMVDWEKGTSGAQTTEEVQLSGDKVGPKNKDKGDNKIGSRKNDSSDDSSDDDDDDDVGGDDAGEDDEEKSRDKSKPISSTPVSGTAWCVVWTGDGRVFFFNPAKRTSVWERPEELISRTDVDKILDEPPKEFSEKKTEPPTKKQKIENKSTKMAMLKEEKSGHNKMEVMNTDSGDVTMKEMTSLSKEAAKEAEEKAAKERALLPLEVRMAQFREMLVEKQVSAFSVWEKELHKIVFDPRYLLLASRERKLAFENYVQDRSEEERRDKKSQVKDKKEQFKRFLRETDVTSRSTYLDLANQYGNDDRFKVLDKVRDREAVLAEFINDLRNKEKEDKDKTKQAYISLLKEHQFTSETYWSEARKIIDNDVRYKAVDTSIQREEWFKEYVKKTQSRENSDSLSSRDRDKQRCDAEQTFRILLKDMVKNGDDSWKQAKRILKKDWKWQDIATKLERSVRDSIFKDHMSALKIRRK